MDAAAPDGSGSRPAAGGSSGPAAARSSGRRRCVGAARVSSSARTGAVTWGAASTAGRRREMEDAVAVVPDFLPNGSCKGVGGCVIPAATVASECSAEERPAAAASSSPAAASSSSQAQPEPLTGARFFGVYDGHGGSQVANYCAARIHEVVNEEWMRTEDSGVEWQKRWETAFVDAFNRVDGEVIPNAVATDLVGSTALAVVLSGCQIIVSNCGDSRAILCRGSEVIQLTVDHKPDNSAELARIEGGGGRVFYWDGPRVSGILAMSRSIGDRYLRPYVIPVPDVFFTARSEEDECIIMATDGLWDVVSNKDVGEMACRLLRRQHRNGVVSEEAQPPAQVVAEYLMNIALHKNSSDNISVIVVDLKCRSRRRSRT